MRRCNRLTLAVPVAALGLIASSIMVGPAVADPDGDAPTQSEVRRAERAATDARRDVAAVRAELVVANQRAEAARVATATAYEAWNAARWQAEQAEKEARRTAAAERRAAAELAERRAGLDALKVQRFEASPDLDALSAIVSEDSVEGVVTKANTYYGTTVALSQLEAEESAAAVIAGIAAEEAATARAEAKELSTKARAAKAKAEEAEQAALAEAADVAAEKEELVSELARLEGVSVALAAKRQHSLEARAQKRARVAARNQAEDDVAEDGAADGERQSGDEAPEPTSDPERETPADPTPVPEPTPAPKPDPAPAPPSGSVQAVIAFAKAQLGERYVWGAAGPDAWDCSGLVMAAWRKAGVSLPHYSAGQYAASTPISSGQLRPGDLVFWGSNNNPSSIHHVAIYIGDGKIIHAPRTGRPVSIDSMYYWIPPNLFARP